MSQMNTSAKAENDPRIFKEVRAFLKALNSGTGKPIEQLSPAEARKVLVDAQNSVQVIIQELKSLKKQLCRMAKK